MRKIQSMHSQLETHLKKRHNLVRVKSATIDCHFHDIVATECPGECPSFSRGMHFGIKHSGKVEYVIYSALLKPDEINTALEHSRLFRPDLASSVRKQPDGNASFVIWNPYHTHIG